MKIDRGDLAGVDNLFSRMTEAHEQADTAEIGASARVDADQSTTGQIAGAGDPDASGASRPSSVDPKLRDRLLARARQVLDGAFESPSEVRQLVVEDIIDQRYSAQIPSERKAQITETLQMTLTGAPEFRRQVDRMLIVAANQLANP